VSGPIRVVVADDDVRVREDFRSLLEFEDDIVVIGTVNDGANAVSFCNRETPDVVVMDVRMPVMNGIDATRLLREVHDAVCRVLVVTTFDLDDYVLGAIRAGASGFLLKDQAPDQLADAVRTVAAGDAIVAPRATARLLAELVGQPERRARLRPADLTDRGLGIIQLMATGLSNEDISVRAGVSRSTVKTHVSNILPKLGLTSRIQIVVWAYENGWAAPH
jgi:DNA-binding NarL/FixJ family response regulator